MGNYRFKFSDMIPNAWFYKLRDLTKQPTRNHNNTSKKKHQSNQTHVNSPALTSPSSTSMRDRQLHHHHPSSSFSSQSQYQRKSYYFTRDIKKSASPVHDDDDDTSYNRNCRLPGNFYEEAANGVVQQPRRSSKKRHSTRRSRASPRLANSSVRTGYSCRSSVESLKTNLPDSIAQEYPNSAADTSSETEPKSNLTGVTSTETIESTVFSSYSWPSSRLEDDIVIDLKSRPPPATQFDKHVDDNNWKYADFDSVTKIELPLVKTKSDISKEIQPTKTRKQTANSEEESMKTIKNDEKSSQNSKRFSISSHSPGLKLRTNTPRIVTQRIRSRKSVSSNWRKSLSDSFAVVTSSQDPQRDFRESMVEMIVEHNICSSKELEDLLACYLSLNSYKHHDVIINVFKQIWFDFVHT